MEEAKSKRLKERNPQILQEMYKLQTSTGSMRATTSWNGLVMRSAIVHYWLLNMRGGEKVVEALCRLLPDADVFTLFYDPDRVSETIRAHRVQASFLQPLRKALSIVVAIDAAGARKF